MPTDAKKSAMNMKCMFRSYLFNDIVSKIIKSCINKTQSIAIYYTVKIMNNKIGKIYCTYKKGLYPNLFTFFTPFSKTIL